MDKYIFLLVYFGIITISIGGKINSDPAPGRSPGPPTNTFNNHHHHQHQQQIDDDDDEDDLEIEVEETSLHPIHNDVLLFNNHFEDDQQQQLLLPTNTNDNDIFISQSTPSSQSSLNNCQAELTEFLNDYKNSNLLKSWNQLSPPANNAANDIIDFHISHDNFQTDKGLYCGLMYKIQVRSIVSSPTIIRGFYVESVSSSDGLAKGSFIRNDVNHELLPMNWYQENNNLEKRRDASTEGETDANECMDNKWKGSFHNHSNTFAFWILNELCGTASASVEFRIYVRLMSSNNESMQKDESIFKKTFSFNLTKDCNLFLKNSTGILDYTFLPLYSIDCRIYFPSFDEVSFQQPPGYLIQLTRLNIMCDTGSFLQFSGRQKLCGKLEELNESDLNYHFNIDDNSTIHIYKNTMFSLKYQLVDYCYNKSVNDKNQTFYIEPIRNSLECLIKIHLPYGNKVKLTIITNYGSANNIINNDMKGYHEFTTNDDNNEINLNQISHNNISSSPIMKSRANNNNNNLICDGGGILLKLIENNFNKWMDCIQETSEMEKYSFVSTGNILIIHINKQSSSSMPHSTNLDPNSEILVNNQHRPSILLSYRSEPILDIVSECSFGWIAIQQFCVTTIKELMSWFDGEKYCSKIGGHLVSVRTESEQKQINDLIMNSPGYQQHFAYWTGGSDKNFEGDFKWTDGLPFQYSNWFPGWSQHNNYNKQPNDDGLSSQDCIELRKHFRTPPGIHRTTTKPFSESFMWNDRDCNAHNYIICEKQISDEIIKSNWVNDCNKTVSLTKEHPKASIWSPSFPKQYPDNANCYTTITAPSGYRIVLEFEEVVIENEPGCSYDYLEITEPTAINQENESGFTSRYPQKRNNTNNNNNNYKKRNSYEQQQHPNNLFTSINYEIAQANYQNLIQIFTNLYKVRSNYLIQTPNYPKGNLLYQTNTIEENLPKRLCGDWSSKLKLLRYVSNGSYLGLHFLTDYSHHYGGYKAKVFMENTASECSDERLKPYNGSCYLFVSYPEVDWWTAQQICRGMGAQLSSVSSSQEHRFITTSIRNQADYTPQVIYWLGAELVNSGQFEWTDDTKMIFEGWLPGQGQFDKKPTDATCMGLQWKMSPTPMLQSGLYWESEKCRKVGGYVCKKRKPQFNNLDLNNETVSGVEGRLTSPGYPSQYPVNTDYWIHIIAPERSRIIVQFQKIDLESQDECLYDYISIQNYDTVSKIFLEPGTNVVPMAMLKADGNFDEYMNYENDRMNYLRRVRRSYRANKHAAASVSSANRLAKLKRSSTKNNIYKIGESSLAANSQFPNLVSKTHRHSKVGSSSAYFSRKKRRKKRSAKHMAIIQNESFTINPDFQTYQNTQSFLPYVRWCGQHDSNMSKFDFVSTSNEVTVNFHSDYSISGLGFSAIWNAIDMSGCPFQSLTSREGTVTSPNYPHFLINNIDCTYMIQAPIGKKVWLEFRDFDILEEAQLYVDIGNNAFQPYLSRNHINEGIFVSLKEQMKIQIKTSQKPRGRGFQALYKTVGPVIQERIVQLSNNSNGNLYHLNYPGIMPNNIDFTQHLIAPLGDMILLEVFGVEFSTNGCLDDNMLEIYDYYADTNGTKWILCKTSYIKPDGIHMNFSEHVLEPPVHITSYLNTLHIQQKTSGNSYLSLNATVHIQQDVNYKFKLASGDELVESCQPDPCQYQGKCITNGDKKHCQCHGHFTGRFCGLNLCELEPCIFGKCELTQNSFKCHCQPGYIGHTCEQKQKPCADNPCEGRGECFEKNGGFACRCHAWWEGRKCERRMLHIPYKPLSERMLQEPFWLGLITVFVVLAFIGLVWCAKRHFPEKIEKLLAEEADRNRPAGSLHGHHHHHHHTSLREQLQFTSSVPQGTTGLNTQGAPRSIFNRLGIRKPSILSLSSPNPSGGATARTFSLDDLLQPLPRRSPSPRKKRNNSTPVKKNAAEKKQILQQLVSPAAVPPKPKLSLGELIQMSENRLKASNSQQDANSTNAADAACTENILKETMFTDDSINRPLNDPKLEKKVTFARLLNKVSAEMSSGSELDIGSGTRNSSALSLPTDIQFRPNSVPQSPCTNDIRSPHSTSSNQGSDSLSSSELVLTEIGLRLNNNNNNNHNLHNNNNNLHNNNNNNSNNRRIRPKVSSADSILAMFRNFASATASGTTLPTSSILVSPSTTPTASSPQDDAPGDDESSTSSMHTPVSYSSGPPDSPVFYRQTTIEVPVLDAISAHKTTQNPTNLLHPPTVLLEIPTNGINNKCLSPIRELPTPMPSPALTPIMPRPSYRSNSPVILQDKLLSANYTDDDDDDGGDDDDDDGDENDDNDDDDDKTENISPVNVMPDFYIEINRFDSDIETTPIDTTATPAASFVNITSKRLLNRTKFNSLIPNITIEIEPPTPDEKVQRPRDLIIPTLMVEHPSPTKDRFPMIIFPGSPPPQRASIGETSFMFPNKHQQKRLLKQFDKPTSLDLPFVPPTITITSNLSELESDTDPLSPASKISGTTLLVPGNTVGMCYLSPFAMCSRADRTISESNLSSSGYSSMASPGPSRCGSSNPLCPNEMDDSNSGHSGSNFSLHANLLSRRQSSILSSCKENITNGKPNRVTGINERIRLRSDSETLSDDALLESNDEGIGTDHIDEKLEETEINNKADELEVFADSDLVQSGKKLMIAEESSTTIMAQLQLPSIIIQSDGTEKGLSPVSSRSESPLSEKAGIGRFSPHFYGRKDQHLPFTDSDGLYDFPSSDGKGTSNTHQRRSSSKKRDRKSNKNPPTQSSPPKNQLDLPGKEPATSYSCSKHFHSHHHNYHANNINSRKSPKRRPAQKHPVASSSSSTESLTSARDLTLRLNKRIPSPNLEKLPSVCKNLVPESDDDTGTEISNQILPKLFGEEQPTKPKSKTSRLRAIGNQIRFLRRLEKSIKLRDKQHSPDSSPDDDLGVGVSKLTCPLLQPTAKTRTIARQKRLQSISTNNYTNVTTNDKECYSDSKLSD